MNGRGVCEPPPPSPLPAGGVFCAPANDRAARMVEENFWYFKKKPRKVSKTRFSESAGLERYTLLESAGKARPW
jgi:hypothetical protein